MTAGAPTAAPSWKGLDTSLMPVFIGYDQVERMVAALLESAAAWRPDAVVGIARGGMAPAAMAAGILALPLSFVSHDRLTGAVTWIGPPAPGGRILLVDDCCSTGITLHHARNALEAEGRTCLTMVIVHDPDVVQHLPDLSHPMRALFRLPWERGEATPTGRAAKASGGITDSGVEAPFVGIGLDEALLAALALPRTAVAEAGGAQTAVDRVPRIAADRAVFISGLPEQQKPRIALALAPTSYANLPLICAGAPGDKSTVARWKAETATRWGCTHFIECDSEQAICISATAPHLLVTWWDTVSRQGWTIGAAAQPSATGGHDPATIGGDTRSSALPRPPMED
jgi:hypoxanthine phosphoribosyltransferase